MQQLNFIDDSLFQALERATVQRSTACVLFVEKIIISWRETSALPYGTVGKLVVLTIENNIYLLFI